MEGPGRATLGEALVRIVTGNPIEASSWLDLPEATPSTRDRALLLRARVALVQHRPSEAVEPLNRVDPSGPSAIEADYWKGRTLQEAGNVRAAIAWYRLVLERRPGDIESWRWLAAASYDLGNWKEAVDALKTLTRLDPKDARSWRTLGVLYKEEGDWARSKDSYEASLAVDPDQPQARLELAEVLVRLGMFEAAVPHLDACKGLVPEPDRLDLLAQTLRARGDVPRLLETLEDGVSRFPDHAGLLSLRGLVDQSAGRLEESLPWFDRAVRAEPNNSQWLYQRGRTLQALGRVEEARRDVTRANELKADTAEMSNLSNRAMRDADDPLIRCQLGQVCRRLGKLELAAYWYRAALACDPTNLEATLGLKAIAIP